MTFLLMLALFILAIFLIVLVLIQKGRGGGLAGALGGMGGQSAFGTKAGDLFTRITIGVAAVWILVCILSVGVLSRASSSRLHESMFRLPGEEGTTATAPTTPQPEGGQSGQPASDSATSGNQPSGGSPHPPE